MPRRTDAQRLLMVHRFAVQLYETLAEQHGIDHEQTKLALRLVEETRPDDGSVVVLIQESRTGRRSIAVG